MARSRGYSTRPKIACTRKKAFWPGASTRWGRAAAKYSAVVPANAGTQPPASIVAKGLCRFAKKHRSRGMGPGVRRDDDKMFAPFDSQPPTPDNRHDVSIPRKQNHPDKPDPRAPGRPGR